MNAHAAKALNPADELALSGFSARSRELLRHVLTSPVHQADFMQSELDRVAARRSLVDQLKRARSAAESASNDTAAEKRLQKMARDLEQQREQLKAAESALREAAHQAEMASRAPATEACEIERALRNSSDGRLVDLRIELQKLADKVRGKLVVTEIRMKNWLGQLRVEYDGNHDDIQRAAAMLKDLTAATFDMELEAMSFDDVTLALARLCGPDLAAVLKPLDLSPPWIHSTTFRVHPAPESGALPHPLALKPQA